jgi:DNA-binding NarL/FixJ family response regulator
MKLYIPVRMILADDHELFRDGFIAMLKKEPDIEIVGEAKDADELIKLTRELKPDVIVTDILMPPGMNGIEATKKILTEFPEIGIIALSMFNDENLLSQMIEAGAKGYLLKNAHKDEIIEAVKTVYRGHNYYCKSTTIKLTKILTNDTFFREGQNRKTLFSEKERAIIVMICKGFSSQKMADELHRSIRTIESHRKNICRKINAKNVADIINYAIKHKIYIPGETSD